MTENTATRLRKAMNIRNIKQIELSEKTKIGKSAISQYLSGKVVPKQDKIYLMAQILNVNEGWLMGYDVPMEREQVHAKEQNSKEEIDNPDIRMIARAGKKMTTEQAKLLRKYAEFTFPEAFDNDGN